MTRGFLAAENVLGLLESLSAMRYLLAKRLSDNSLCHLGLRLLSEEIEGRQEKSCEAREGGCQLLSQMPSQALKNKRHSLGYDHWRPAMDVRFL